MCKHTREINQSLRWNFLENPYSKNTSIYYWMISWDFWPHSIYQINKLLGKVDPLKYYERFQRDYHRSENPEDKSNWFFFYWCVDRPLILFDKYKFDKYKIISHYKQFLFAKYVLIASQVKKPLTTMSQNKINGKVM